MGGLGLELKAPDFQPQPRAQILTGLSYSSLLLSLTWTWSSQGSDLYHLLCSFCLHHVGVEETLPLASCPSLSWPTAFSLCPLTTLLAHRHTHTLGTAGV